MISTHHLCLNLDLSFSFRHITSPGLGLVGSDLQLPSQRPFFNGRMPSSTIVVSSVTE